MMGVWFLTLCEDGSLVRVHGQEARFSAVDSDADHGAACSSSPAAGEIGCFFFTAASEPAHGSKVDLAPANFGSLSSGDGVASPIMWQLSISWWELVLRVVIIYGFLLVLIRLSGKRQVGQLAPFDLVLLL